MPPRWSPEDDRAVELERTAEQLGGAPNVAVVREPADQRRRDTLDQRHLARLEPERAQQREVAAAGAAEPKAGAGDDGLGPERKQVLARERLGVHRRDLRREADDEHVFGSCGGQQLEAPLERREQLDAVSEHRTWMRVERDDRRPRHRPRRPLDHRPVAEVDTVERPDRDRPRLVARARPARARRSRRSLPGRLLECEHAGSHRRGHTRSRCSSERRSSATDGGSSSTDSTSAASSTLNGPTVNRRSDVQWPPSACAIART